MEVLVVTAAKDVIVVVEVLVGVTVGPTPVVESALRPVTVHVVRSAVLANPES